MGETFIEVTNDDNNYDDDANVARVQYATGKPSARIQYQ
jgi:hypothetical protein